MPYEPPDSLLRGPVSTALTWTGPTSMFPAGIVGILRFFFGVRIRCAFNVSTLDTNDLPGLFPSAHRHPQDHQPVSGPVRASVSEVMTLKRLRSEEISTDGCADDRAPEAAQQQRRDPPPSSALRLHCVSAASLGGTLLRDDSSR